MAYFDYIISPSRIRQKRSHVHGEAPPPGSLRPGEIAVNAADGKMYVGTTGDSVTEIAGGGGGGASTGDITFSGVQIIGAGTASGDGYGFSTIEVVPDSDLYANHQYLVIDPTAPNHIHIRAGGPQDGSNAEIILGGEHAHVRVVDQGHEVAVRASTGGPQSITFGENFGYLSSPVEFPEGSNFEWQGNSYSVSTAQEQDLNGTPFWRAYVYGPTPPDADPEQYSGLNPFYWSYKTVTVNTPFNGKTWTFDRYGALYLAEGGLRFADNSVQTTAPQNFAYSYQDGDYGGGRSIGAHSMDVYSLPNGGTNSVVVSADFQGGTDDGWDARVVLSHMPSPGGATNTLTISAANGITFPDNTTQGSAGIVSVFGGWGFGSLQRVQNIIKISQADYDILAYDGSLSPNTVYIIVG